jgi:hypothetical protein
MQKQFRDLTRSVPTVLFSVPEPALIEAEGYVCGEGLSTMHNITSRT